MENFILGQAWAWSSGRGQMGGEQLPPGPRGAHPTARCRLQEVAQGHAGAVLLPVPPGSVLPPNFLGTDAQR